MSEVIYVIGSPKDEANDPTPLKRHMQWVKSGIENSDILKTNPEIGFNYIMDFDPLKSFLGIKQEGQNLDPLTVLMVFNVGGIHGESHSQAVEAVKKLMYSIGLMDRVESYIVLPKVNFDLLKPEFLTKDMIEGLTPLIPSKPAMTFKL